MVTNPAAATLIWNSTPRGTFVWISPPESVRPTTSLFSKTMAPAIGCSAPRVSTRTVSPTEDERSDVVAAWGEVGATGVLLRAHAQDKKTLATATTNAVRIRWSRA